MTDLPEFRDVTGVPLAVGMVVAWHIGGRYNSGLVLGKVTSATVVDRAVNRYDYATKTTTKEPYKAVAVECTPLIGGRKKRQLEYRINETGDIADQHYREDIVAIMNQEFQGDGVKR